jgi:NAD(P)-dependent dehydrogenase (short-subunit alcohol dehydrogenase family)
VLDVDLNGAFRLTQLCAREMHRAGRGGSIVQIGSVHTHASLAGAAPYDAAKCGVVGFSKAAAVELAAFGIRVNILSPGLCGTEIWKDIVAAAPSEKECQEYWNANIPGQRLVTPLEVAKCCVFLLSDDSSCITGANIFAVGRHGGGTARRAVGHFSLGRARSIRRLLRSARGYPAQG